MAPDTETGGGGAPRRRRRCRVGWLVGLAPSRAGGRTAFRGRCAVVVLVLAIGLSSHLLLATTLPADMVWALRANEIWLVLLLGSFVLVLFPGFLLGRATLFGALASGLGGLLLVSLGAECIGVGAMAWADLPGVARGNLDGILLAACLGWIVAFLLSRLEARRPYRWDQETASNKAQAPL